MQIQLKFEGGTQNSVSSVFPQTAQAMLALQICSLGCLVCSYPIQSAMHCKVSKCERHEKETAHEHYRV